MTNTPLQTKLEAAFAPATVNIIDNSWQHAGHVGMPPVGQPMGGTHLAITIVSARFQGVSLMDRHRMVHQVLKEDMTVGPLHALELKVLTPEEAN